MSEPRLISPMLDGCIIGEAISCHNGVRCFPAIRQSTGEKYIVKVLSIPASQVQLEALLLTGAYDNKETALAYFQELSQEILKEKDILASLSRLEGFTPYIDAQVEPMEDGVGYEVYLLSPYKRSMERLLATDTLTHLSAVNMGLDLCAALAACRRAGYLYVDLKPENIFFTQEQDYRIGDLGFVPLSSLHCTTLPEKYHSAYSPAEVLDTMAVLNDTADTYALGLILYQAYNGGQLPVLPEDGSALPAPMYADYEMAEIILKACAQDPTQRWEDPAKMGQALVDYMQRNAVNDTPIIPPVLEAEKPSEEETEEFLPEQEPQPEELAFLQELTSDETAPTVENTENLTDAPLTEETSQMLAQADDLIAHELPTPVVAPEAAEVPMPDPIAVPMPQISLEQPEPEVPQEATEETEETEEAEAADEIAEPAPEAPKEEEAPKKERRSLNVKALVITLLVLILLACAALGGWYYYENIYLQNVDSILVDGSESTLTVQIDSDISDELLTVYCTDSYGNNAYSPVTAGIAVFQGLNPSTRYAIRVEISGFHKLTGVTTSSFTTDGQAEIQDFQAVIGPTDGSALLSFNATGNAGNEWLLSYSAEGVEEKTLSFTGQSVTVTDLVIGSEYSFRLSCPDGTHLIGQTQTSFVPSKLVFAENMTITACGGGSLSLSWDAPEGETVESWTLRCYNESGYNQTVVTSGLSYTFTELDHSSSCTVEIFADNMSQSNFIIVSPNPITVTGFHFDSSTFGLLKITWDYEGAAPEGGWVLSYTADGLGPQILNVTENTAEFPVIPGSNYDVTLQVTTGGLLFNGSASCDIPDVGSFSGYGLSTDFIESDIVLHPGMDNWGYYDLSFEHYVNSFSAGQKVGILLHALTTFDYSQDNVHITYLIRNSDGSLYSMQTQDIIWDVLFPDAFCALDIPAMPDAPGQYTISVYFNGKFVTVHNFSIV